MKETYTIKGMGCAHCKAAVEKAIGALKGCETVKVDLEKGTAEVTGSVSRAEIIKAVTLAGFTVV